MPLVSVIIPIYNAASTLAETLTSVQNQSFKDFEVVLIDDGSTDESASIIREWIATSDIEPRVISQENQGLGAARNRGIEAAKGDWLALLDADDLWHADKLMALHTLLNSSTEVGVYYHKVYNFNAKRKSKRPSAQVTSLRELLTKSNPLVPSAVVLRKSIALRFPFSEDRSLHGAEDLHLWVRLLSAEVIFQYNSKAVTLYRAEGGMSSDLNKHLDYVFNALTQLRLAGFITNLIALEAKARKFYEAGRFYQKKGEFKRADEYYRKGQIRGPKARILILANRLGLAI